MNKVPNPVDIYVGRQLRARRLIMGMSQGRLGERLGLTFQQVQKYEKGSNRIGASRLYEMSLILGVSVNYFFESIPTDDMAAVADGEVPWVEDAARSADSVRLNRSFRSIRSSEVRRGLVDLAHVLAQTQ